MIDLLEFEWDDIEDAFEDNEIGVLRCNYDDEGALLDAFVAPLGRYEFRALVDRIAFIIDQNRSRQAKRFVPSSLRIPEAQ